jgi:hypothetical protein
MNIDRGVGAHARSKLVNIRGQNSRTKPTMRRIAAITRSCVPECAMRRRQW